MKKFVLLYLITLITTLASAQSIQRTVCNGNLVRLDSLLKDQSIHVKDDRGRSLLHWAVACRQKEIFDLLIQKGLSVDLIDDQGRTPLHTAVRFENLKFIKELIQLQSDDSWQLKYGASLLELAVLNDNVNSLEKLLDYGVDINLRNNRGSTALEISERTGKSEMSEFLVGNGADSDLVREIKLSKNYMGQTITSSEATLFAPNFISTEENEFGSVFNSDGTELYYAVDLGKRNEIRFSELVNGEWTKPKPIISHHSYSFNDPFLSNDEQRLFYISDRALDGQGNSKDIDIWYSNRLDKGRWSEPIHAGVDINTKQDEYYISFTSSETMYFASNGLSGQDSVRTDHDIYYSEFSKGEFQKPVRLGQSINTENYEADVFVAPDESYIIFCSVRDDGYGRGDLYISFKDNNGIWSQAVNMGEKINSNHYEYCPFVTNDGKMLLFTSNQDIYSISTDVIKQLKKQIN